MAESITIPQIWQSRGIKTPQQVVDAINESYKTREKLGSNIFIGKTFFGNICLVMSSENKKIADAFPVKTDRSDYEKIRQEVHTSGLCKPDEMHLEIISLSIAIDYLNYYDQFANKEEINGRYALFQSSFHYSDLGEIIIIKVENVGQLVAGYDAVKGIVDQYIEK